VKNRIDYTGTDHGGYL